MPKEKAPRSGLSRRLQNELVAPDFQNRGYQLVGGRLLPASVLRTGRASSLYETEAGERSRSISNRTSPGASDDFRFTAYDGVSAFWLGQGRATWHMVLIPGTKRNGGVARRCPDDAAANLLRSGAASEFANPFAFFRNQIGLGPVPSNFGVRLMVPMRREKGRQPGRL